MKIKNSKFQDFLNSSSSADVELVLKAKKLPNGKFAISTSYELSLEQLKTLDIKFSPGTKEEDVKRDPKPPKWFSDFAIQITKQINDRFDSVDKRLSNIENLPTIKKELNEVKVNSRIEKLEHK